MESLVLSLQSDAMDGAASVLQLLRKARALAVKLDSPKLSGWISNELSGYGSDADVPEYRKVSGRPMYRNPYHGLQPVVIRDEFTEKVFSLRNVIQPVSELESLAAGNGTIYIPYTGDMAEYIMRNAGLPIEPILVIQKASVAGILESIRNAVLEWTLELEKNGVLGEGLTFSSADKKNAVAATYNITNNIGEMHGSSIQQAGGDALYIKEAEKLGELLTIVDRIYADIEKLALDTQKRDLMEAEIATLRAQSKSPQPRGGTIEAALDSIKSILEAAAGNVTATAYLSELGVFS